MHVNYLVTLKQDGSLWLEDEPIAEQALLERAKQEYKRNPRFAVVVRADQNIDYGLVVALLDKLRRRLPIWKGCANRASRAQYACV
jgi:biopolymer transport protein ExbD